MQVNAARYRLVSAARHIDSVRLEMLKGMAIRLTRLRAILVSQTMWRMSDPLLGKRERVSR